MPTGRYHEMLPAEILRRRAAFPVAFLPLGTLEWHGFHAAVGLDGLKAEGLAEMTAEATGGFAFPTLWYGEPRGVSHMDAAEPESPKVRAALELPEPAVIDEADPEDEIERFQALVRGTIGQLHSAGMNVVCVVCGHYPMREWVDAVARDMGSSDTTRVIVGSDADFVDPPDDEVAGADHAGVWETSYLWHLRPECVDMTVYEEADQLIGVLGEDPRRRASAELGAAACERIVAGISARAREALAALVEPDQSQ